MGPGTGAITVLEGTLGNQPRQVEFLATYWADLLPTPSNLKIWGKEEDPSCKQCEAALCTLNHILMACPKALGDGRYRWRHNKVLTEVAKWVDMQRVKSNNNQAPQSPKFINFQCEGNHTHTDALWSPMIAPLHQHGNRILSLEFPTAESLPAVLVNVTSSTLK